jgi:hypothetical protein
MIFGAHIILFSTDADADREFLGTIFGLDHVDAGGGWLIFGLPPAEVAVHPDEAPGAQLYLMCDDLDAEIARLGELDVECSAAEQLPWGSMITVRMPGGGDLGVYQPRHPTMVEGR